jgi:surface antigen
VNSTVGVRLRRTAGGGAIFAIGLGALWTPPATKPAAVEAASAVSMVATISQKDPPIAHAERQVVMLYVRATPEPAAPATVRATSAPGASWPRAPRVAASPAKPQASSAVARGGAFAYGYCTWWVAHKRPIPWRGNAAQWWWNARAFGVAEGSVPRAGAIMVMGTSGTSPQGHVGFVESVRANGSFVVSEMNWWGVPGGGWGRVDYRAVTSMRGILGFIY